MKIIFIQTNYPNFLASLYKNKKVANMTYKQMKKIWSKEYFGASNFYLKNLKQYGWDGDEVIANDENSQNAWARENNISTATTKLSILKYIPERIKNLLDINNSQKQIVLKQIETMKPDVVYIHDVTYFKLSELKKIKSMTKIIVGQIAYPKPINMNIFKGYDLIISSLPNYIKDFKKMGIQTEYLKWCFEDTILDDIKVKDRIYDVTYIGGFSPHHSNGNKVLEHIAKEININFWGYGQNFLSPISSIRKNYKGEAWGKKMFEIFSKSKIVINRHINISKQYANNMRLFEATGMGALLITDKKINNNEFFVVNKEILEYSNPNNLIKKIKYYLKNDKKRIAIAKAGQSRTLKEHTYRIRMRELDHILRKHIKLVR